MNNSLVLPSQPSVLYKQVLYSWPASTRPLLREEQILVQNDSSVFLYLSRPRNLLQS